MITQHYTRKNKEKLYLHKKKYWLRFKSLKTKKKMILMMILKTVKLAKVIIIKNLAHQIHRLLITTIIIKANKILNKK